MIWYSDIDIYRCSVLFIVESTAKEFKKYCKENNLNFTEETYNLILDDIKNEDKCDGVTYSIGYAGNYIVFLRNTKLEVVVHELFHLVNSILCDREVTYDEQAEAWAYLIGWVTQDFYNTHDKLKSVNNNPKKVKKKK